MPPISNRLLAITTMVAAIGVTVLGWLTSDRVYQRNQMAGYLIG